MFLQCWSRRKAQQTNAGSRGIETVRTGGRQISCWWKPTGNLSAYIHSVSYRVCKW